MLYRKFNNSLLYIAALVAFAFLFWFTEENLKQKNKERLESALQTSLQATQVALHVWARKHKTSVLNFAKMSQVRRPAARLLSVNYPQPAEKDAADRRELRRGINDLISSHGYLGFSVITLDGKTVASMREDNTGSLYFVSKALPDLFARVKAGETLVSQPVQSDVPLMDSSGEVRTHAATMFALAPLRHSNGNIIGVLALRINPLLEFSTIFARGRSGATGETYGFDQNGIMLSESRFTPALMQVGLLANGELSVLNIAIRNPGQNLLERYFVPGKQKWPLTKMAAAAIEGNAGMSLKPYLDYLGVPVVGAWLWDQTLAFGVASEINASEAYSSLETSISTIRIFAFLIALLLVSLFVLQEKNRRATSQNNKALKLAKNRAEAANRAKMEFISAMSHDLRTPLNAVIGFSQLLAEGNVGQREQQQYLGYIVRSGSHLLSLLNEVLEFAKLDIGELSFSLEEYHPQDLIEDSMVMVEDMAKLNRIALLEISDYEKLPYVWADHTRAKQVLVNFLTNAVKYNRIGGSVYVSATEVNNQLRFEVRDTGRGIATDKLVELWEPYNRIGAEKTAIEGSGIGLAFSKALVEGLGGKIGAESVVGQGSSFWFSLPIFTLEEEKAPAAPAPKKPALDQFYSELEDTQILYVEDLELNQLIVRKMLKGIRGLSLICVETAESGLEVLSEKEFDVVLADIQLPDMDGFEFNKCRKKRDIAPKVPIIALSADVTAETKKKAEEGGFSRFIEKPILREELLSGLADAVMSRDTG